MLKPSGSLFVNLGDKYAGSAGHNNAGIAKPHTGSIAYASQAKNVTSRPARRTAPDRYNQASDGVRAKSLMGLPWRYAIGCIDGQADPEGKGWILRSEIVWAKPNGLPESVTDRVRRSHEQWFHLTKEGRYYSNVDEVREPSSEAERPQARRAAELATAAGLTEAHREALLARGLGDTKKSAITKDGTGKNTPEVMRLAAEADAALGSYAREFTMSAATLGKLPGSVWTVPTQPLIVPDWLGVDHFAAFPTEWPRRIITAWSPSGICTACGEGRHSVTEKNRVVLGDKPERSNAANAHVGGDRRKSAFSHTEVRFTGEACACPDTSAPTRPAVVLDPFGGTGTTAMVARALGRYGVSLDLSADYLRLARWRIFDSGGAAKVRGRDNADRQGVLL